MLEEKPPTYRKQSIIMKMCQYLKLLIVSIANTKLAVKKLQCAHVKNYAL